MSKTGSDNVENNYEILFFSGWTLFKTAIMNAAQFTRQLILVFARLFLAKHISEFKTCM